MLSSLTGMAGRSRKTESARTGELTLRMTPSSMGAAQIFCIVAFSDGKPVSTPARHYIDLHPSSLYTYLPFLVEGEVADDGQIFGSMTNPQAGLVFIECHV